MSHVFKLEIKAQWTLVSFPSSVAVCWHHAAWSDQIRSDQSLSRVRLFATPWIAARQASLSITNSRSSLRLTSIESVMLSSHLILCCPFFTCPQSLPASESFPMSQLFAWGGQSTGVSALSSFLPKKSQGWSPSEWTDCSCKTFIKIKSFLCGIQCLEPLN